MPAHWQRRNDLNEEASIQGADKTRDEYLILMSIPKSELSGTLEEIAELSTDGLLEQYSDLQRGSARKFQIKGMDVVQHDLTGWVGSMQLAYLNSVVEGPFAYHQILAWTPVLNQAEAFEVFTKVLNSIEVHSEAAAKESAGAPASKGK